MADTSLPGEGMTIRVGDNIPAVPLKTMTKDGISEISVADLFDNKKVVLFSLPGAFTPTCSAKHLPGFVERAADIKAKGVDTIACLSVNDPFVMDAWAKQQNVGDTILMLADGNAEFSASIGLTFDASGAGMGTRGQRFAMVVDNGVVSALNIEEPGAFEVSSAEAILKLL